MFYMIRINLIEFVFNKLASRKYILVGVSIDGVYTISLGTETPICIWITSINPNIMSHILDVIKLTVRLYF